MGALYSTRTIPYLLRDLPNQGSAIQLKLRTLLRRYPGLTNYVFLPKSRPLLRQRALRTLVATFTRARGRARQTVFQLKTQTTSNPSAIIKDPILFKYKCFPALHALPRNGNNDIILGTRPRRMRVICTRQQRRLLSTSAPRTLRRLSTVTTR